VHRGGRERRDALLEPNYVSTPAFVSLVHLGCARNLIDSELMLGRMAEEGLVVTTDQSAAHTVVLNTCSFIGPAREESYGAIRELLERKKSGEIEAVVVAGCLVQRYRQQLREQFPGVDVFAEISDYRALAKRVRRMVDGHAVESYLEGPGLRPAERDGARLLATPGSYAYLRISHGCDHTCSFCAIPSIRGPHRSKRPVAVLEEATELIAAGVKELVLVAEDSTAWGREFDMELPQLVEALAELDGDFRLRIMYAYPNRFPWDLTRLLAEHPKVLPYLDIPIQHAATDVLRAMQRAGSGDQVRRILTRLYEEVPDLTLRTTVLLGFPGERDEHVAELMELISEFRLGRLGAFSYSPEEGTSGYQIDETVAPELAEERRLEVLARRDEVLRSIQEQSIGRELEVLVDEAEADSSCVARSVMDAPEVDMLTLVDGAAEACVGDRLQVRVDALDEELNFLATPV
jgi:ribosomal protein S12 methylthiotransferase